LEPVHSNDFNSQSSRGKENGKREKEEEWRVDADTAGNVKEWLIKRSASTKGRIALSYSPNAQR
jgi:hypothetical protein